jgi:transcription antitermination protein NusB
MPAPGPGRRRAARRQALDILYQADVIGRPPTRVMAEWRSAGRQVQPYADSLVQGVERHLEGIDDVLGRHAEEWTVARMAVVDRTILRVACYELATGIPVGVVVNEAVEAAKELSTEDSGRFVNGVLGRIAREGAAEGLGGDA